MYYLKKKILSFNNIKLLESLRLMNSLLIIFYFSVSKKFSSHAILIPGSVNNLNIFDVIFLRNRIIIKRWLFSLEIPIKFRFSKLTHSSIQQIYFTHRDKFLFSSIALNIRRKILKFKHTEDCLKQRSDHGTGK
jgi:hypothetical protein